MTEPISGTGPIGQAPSADVPFPLVGSGFRDDTVATTVTPANNVSYLAVFLGVQPAGTYRGVVSYFVGTDSSQTAYWFDVFVNGSGTAIGAAVEQLNPAGTQAPRTSVLYFPHSGGTLDLDARIARGSGSGDIIFFRCLMEFYRVTAP